MSSRTPWLLIGFAALLTACPAPDSGASDTRGDELGTDETGSGDDGRVDTESESDSEESSGEGADTESETETGGAETETGSEVESESETETGESGEHCEVESFPDRFIFDMEPMVEGSWTDCSILSAAYVGADESANATIWCAAEGEHPSVQATLSVPAPEIPPNWVEGEAVQLSTEWDPWTGPELGFELRDEQGPLAATLWLGAGALWSPVFLSFESDPVCEAQTLDGGWADVQVDGGPPTSLAPGESGLVGDADAMQWWVAVTAAQMTDHGARVTATLTRQ